MPLLRLGGVLTLPTGTARSVRGLHGLSRSSNYAPTSLKATGVYLQASYESIFSLCSSDLVESGFLETKVNKTLALF